MRHARKYFRIFAGQLFNIQPDMQIWWTPELPIIHVANPKAGCSSINQSHKAVQAGAFARANLDFNRVIDPHVADDCLRERGLPPSSCRQRYLISSVRNPFARALSGYLDKIEGQDHRVYNEVRNLETVSFADFLQALKKFKAHRMDGHFRPQHLNLNYPKVAYDAIFFLENPQPISDFVSQIEPHFRLERFAPHARGAADRLAAYYDVTTAQLVREIFARDFELFGYSINLDDALSAPGAMVSGGRLIPHGAAPKQGAKPDQAAPRGGALEPTLRFRRLIEKRLI